MRATSVTPVNTQRGPEPIRAASCEANVVKQFAHLKAGGHIASAVIFPGPIDPAYTEGLASDYDIHFHYDSQRNETILL
jgi:hypothetical protein